jgi:tetratricopeptide (TPR) repeat protein
MQKDFFARIDIPGHGDDTFDELMGISGQISAAAGAAREDNGNIKKLLSKAQEHYFRGSYIDGIHLYAQVLHADPRRPHAWIGQVRILVDTGRYESAIYWADKGAALLKEERPLCFAHAYALACAGRLDQARAMVNIPVQKDETPMSWLLRGEALIRMKIGFIDRMLKPYKDIGRLGAFFCFLKALSSDPHDPFINQRIGLAYMLAKDHRRAFTHLEASLELANDNPLTLYGLAQCYRMNRDDKRAIWYVKRAIAGNPHLDCAYTLLQQLHNPRYKFSRIFRAARKEIS